MQEQIASGATFQCLNRHEQPSSHHICCNGHRVEGFNASIGTSNLQARAWQRRAAYWSRSFNASIGTSNLQAQVALSNDARCVVSMPQSARATFKPHSHTCRSRQYSVSMPQSARATFKLGLAGVAVDGISSFNASIGTSNLQACSLPASTSSRRPCFNASIGTSNLQAWRGADFLLPAFCRVSMPQSARATFKQVQGAMAEVHNAWFQCLNRHEQPSSAARRGLQPRRSDVSMPQSALATFKPQQPCPINTSPSCFNASIGTSNLQAGSIAGLAAALPGFNASIGTSNLQALDPLPGRARLARFNASIGTSNLQARLARPVMRRWPVSMPQSARATFKPGC